MSTEERSDVEEFLSAQRELIELSATDLTSRWEQQPARSVLSFGAGQQAQQPLLGNPQMQFRGVTVLNPTEKTIYLGFDAGAGAAGQLTVPPNSGLTWPAVFCDLSVGVSAGDAAAALGNVIVLRLFYPPAQPMAFPYSPTPVTRGLVPGMSPTIFEEGAAEKIVNENSEGKLLRILSFNWDLKTSATAGNRFVGYEITDPKGHTQVEVLTPALAKTEQLYGICGFLGAGAVPVSETSRTINLPLPQLLLPKGWKWEAIAPFKQAGDSFPLFRLAVEWV